MKNCFIRVVSAWVFTFLAGFVSAQCYTLSVTETVSPTSNTSLSLLTLSTCTEYQVAYELTNTTGASGSISDVISIALPNGISYSSFVGSLGATVTYVSGTNTPVFNISGWAPNSTAKLTFLIRTPDCTTVPTSNSVTQFSGNPTCPVTASVSNSFSIVTPTLSAVNASGSGSLLKNTGDVSELVFELKNISTNGAEISEITLTPTPDPTIALLGNFYLSTSSAIAPGNNIYTYVYPTPSASVSGNSPVGSTITLNSANWSYFFPSGSLPQGQTIYLHIPYRVATCGNSGGSYVVNLGCNTAVCQTISLGSDIGVVTNNPSMIVQNYTAISNGTFCAPASSSNSTNIGFVYKNNGTPISGAPAGNAKATNLKFYLLNDADLGDLNLSSLVLSNGTFNLTVPSGIIVSTTFTYLGNPYELHEINLAALTVAAAGSWSPLGPNSLSDIDGDGFVDDLAETNTFTITGVFDYNTVTCPIRNTCGGGYNISSTQLKYNNQCFSLMPPDVRVIPYSITNTAAGGYYYSASGGAASLTLPSDVLEGPSAGFDATICTATYYERFAPVGFDFDCPNGYHQIRLNLPVGYHIDPAGLTVLSPGTPGINSPVYQMAPIVATARCGAFTQTITPTVQEICGPGGSSPGYLLINFGRINSSSCGPYKETYDLPCINVPLFLDCQGTMAACPTIPANFGFDNFDFSLEYVCDPGCSDCASEIVCNSGVTYHHCSGACDSYFSTYNTFEFQRVNVGTNNPTALNSCSPAAPLNSAIEPDIDLHSAYPGDVIRVQVDGNFWGSPYLFPVHTGASYNSMYLQVRHDQVVGAADFRLFDLDLTQGNITITEMATMNTLVVPSNTLTYTCVNNAGTIEYSFALSAAAQAFISNPTSNYQFVTDLYLIARTTPNSGAFTTFYPGFAPYPLVSLRAEYMGTDLTNNIDYSCDSWGTQFRMLQPRTSIGYYPGPSFNTTSTCDPYYVRFNLDQGGAAWGLFQDDFPNEFKPYAELDPNATITLPPGYQYLYSEYLAWGEPYNSSVTNDNGFGPANPTVYAYPISNEVISGNLTTGFTINYSGISGGGSCWPTSDLDYASFRPFSSIRVFMQPTCTAPASASFTYSGGYTENVNSVYPAYRVHSNFNKSFPVNHINPALSVTPPLSTVNAYTNTIDFDFTICNSNGAAANATWLAIENSSINGLNLAGATVTLLSPYTVLPTATYLDGLGNTALMVYVGNLPVSTCRNFRLTVSVNANGCVPSGSAPVLDFLTVKFGNECEGGTPPSPDISCQQGSVNFSFQRYPSDLQLIVPSGGFPTTPVELCNGDLQYQFILSSSEIGSVSNPAFWMDLPAGINIQNVSFTYPCGSSSTYSSATPDAYTFGSGSLPGWNIASHFPTTLGTNGLSGTTTFPNNQICVTVDLQTSCAYDPTDYIKFYGGGISSCSQQLTVGPAQHRPDILNASPDDNLSVSFAMTTSDGDALLNCNNTATFTVTVQNNNTTPNLHNDVLTVNVPGAPFSVTPGAGGSLSGTTINWNILAGSIPASGSVSYTFTVSLNGTLYCSTNIPVSGFVSFNETIACTSSGGSCALSYTSETGEMSFDACCDTPPCTGTEAVYAVQLYAATKGEIICGYQWSPTTGVSCPTCPNPVIIPPSGTTTYTFTQYICPTGDGITPSGPAFDSVVQTFTFTTAPCCSLETNFDFGGSNCTFNFVSSTTAGTGTSIIGYLWDFGDGNFSNLPNPSHTYTTAGTFTVCLTVTGVYGADTCTATSCHTVTADCIPPCDVMPAFTYTADGCTVFFTDLSTSMNGTVYDWQWDFLDAGGNVIGTLNTQNPSFTFPTSGTYTICLTTYANTANDKCKNTYCTKIDVKCNPCQVFPKFDYTLENCTGYFYDLSTATGLINAWQWDFYDAGGAWIGSSNVQNPVFTFPSSGTYKVCLTVYAHTPDDKCKETICFEIKVDCKPCEVKADFMYKTKDCKLGFIDMSSGNGPIISWSWNFGDLPSGSNNTSTLQNPQHIFTSGGFHLVCLTVTAVSNGDTCTSTVCKEVFVDCPCQLVGDFTIKKKKCKVSLTGIATTPGTITSWAWDFGDPASGASNTSTLQNPSHVFSGSGNYTICLTVTAVENGVTCTYTVCKSVTILCPIWVDCAVTPNFSVTGPFLGSKTRNFTDLSTATGPIVSWYWTFGDGFTSTLQNPSHTYALFGTYTVCLTVTSIYNGELCEETICKTIKVKKGIVIDLPFDIKQVSSMETYPNPTMDQSTVNITSAQDGEVVVTVYNMYGERISELFRGHMDAGDTKRMIFDARDVPPGVYLIKAEIAGNEVLQERLIVTK